MDFLKFIGYASFASVIIASLYLSIKYGNNSNIDFDSPINNSDENGSRNN